MYHMASQIITADSEAIYRDFAVAQSQVHPEIKLWNTHLVPKPIF